MTFKEQPKGITVIHDDIFNLAMNEQLLRKRPNVVYSFDLLEAEIFDNPDDVKRIIKTANELLAPGGFQLHMVPHVQMSKRITALYRRLLRFQDAGKSPVQFGENERALIESGEIMSRGLSLKPDDVEEITREIGATTVKQEVAGGHFVLTIRK